MDNIIEIVVDYKPTDHLKIESNNQKSFLYCYKEFPSESISLKENVWDFYYDYTSDTEPDSLLPVTFVQKYVSIQLKNKPRHIQNLSVIKEESNIPLEEFEKVVMKLPVTRPILSSLQFTVPLYSIDHWFSSQGFQDWCKYKYDDDNNNKPSNNYHDPVITRTRQQTSNNLIEPLENPNLILKKRKIGFCVLCQENVAHFFQNNKNSYVYTDCCGQCFHIECIVQCVKNLKEDSSQPLSCPLCRETWLLKEENYRRMISLLRDSNNHNNNRPGTSTDLYYQQEQQPSSSIYSATNPHNGKMTILLQRDTHIFHPRFIRLDCNKCPYFIGMVPYTPLSCPYQQHFPKTHDLTASNAAKFEVKCYQCLRIFVLNGNEPIVCKYCSDTYHVSILTCVECGEYIEYQQLDKDIVKNNNCNRCCNSKNNDESNHNNNDILEVGKLLPTRCVICGIPDDLGFSKNEFVHKGTWVVKLSMDRKNGEQDDFSLNLPVCSHGQLTLIRLLISFTRNQSFFNQISSFHDRFSFDTLVYFSQLYYELESWISLHLPGSKDIDVQKWEKLLFAKI